MVESHQRGDRIELTRMTMTAAKLVAYKFECILNVDFTVIYPAMISQNKFVVQFCKIFATFWLAFRKVFVRLLFTDDFFYWLVQFGHYKVCNIDFEQGNEKKYKNKWAHVG